MTVASLMIPAVGVPYTVSVGGSRTMAEAAGVREIVVLGADDAPAGRFPFDLTDQVPEAARDATSLQSVTTPDSARRGHRAVGLGDVLIPELREWWGKTDVLVVVDGPSVVGIVRLVDVVAALS